MNKYCALPSARVVAWHTPTGRHLPYKRECRVKKIKLSFKISARYPARVLSCGTRTPVNTSVFRFPCNWKKLHVQYKRECRVKKNKRSFKDSARCPARVLWRGTPTGGHLETSLEDEGENFLCGVLHVISLYIHIYIYICIYIFIYVYTYLVYITCKPHKEITWNVNKHHMQTPQRNTARCPALA